MAQGFNGKNYFMATATQLLAYIPKGKVRVLVLLK